jgi:pyruvate-ferredoxin/flavodoxin oxidoreductase
MELPLTFADFAATEIRFRKHYRVAPPETWTDQMVPLAEFLELDEDEREGLFPYVWSVDRERQLMRLLVAEPIIRSCQDRVEFWRMLKAIARVGEKGIDRGEIESEVRREITGRLASNLMQLATGDGGAASEASLPPIDTSAPASSNGNGATAAAAAAPADNGAPAASGDYMAPWIDTAQCTSCDECIKLNPSIFVYNADKKATIKNPQGGPYKDLVKAAERCTAGVIHPGLPKDRNEKGIEKLIARAEKYNQ